MKLELLKVVAKNGETGTWAFPFKWYKYKWGRSYEPVRKQSHLLHDLREWHRVDESTPSI